MACNETAAVVLQTRKEDPFVGGAGAAVDSAATPVYSRCLSRLIFQDTYAVGQLGQQTCFRQQLHQLGHHTVVF